MRIGGKSSREGAQPAEKLTTASKCTARPARIAAMHVRACKGRRGKAGRRTTAQNPNQRPTPSPSHTGPKTARNQEGGPLLEGGEGREREGEGEGEAGGRGNGPVQASFGPGWEARPNMIP